MSDIKIEKTWREIWVEQWGELIKDSSGKDIICSRCNRDLAYKCRRLKKDSELKMYDFCPNCHDDPIVQCEVCKKLPLSSEEE